ncbi:ATP-binding protein [Streptomyces sp. NPDC093221]|uniref:ATP-binding protein n=1 Tax=Streptomyces sp. NPDC093221 TaxID=3366032 RepID=UPI003803E23C
MMAGHRASPFGFRVEAESEAVPDARRKIAALVRSWDIPLADGAYEDLELLSTELITNAIRYSRAPCAVAVRWTGVRIRVEVTDSDPARPRPRHGSVDAEDGRGLLLVEALSAVWGSSPDPAGKVVWFEVGPDDHHSLAAASRHQPQPWSTPGLWRITTTDGSATSGYLPAWAEDDPSEVGVPSDQLPSRLAHINHRNFFEGLMMPIVAPDHWDGAEEDAVLEGSIDCDPYDEDPHLRVPVVNLQVCVGRWILGLDPPGVAEAAAKLRAHANFLDEKVRPALIAAREDWAAHQPSAQHRSPASGPPGRT